jgi:hypothetical protein
VLWLKRDLLQFKAEQRLAQGDNQGALAEYSKLLVTELEIDIKHFIPEVLGSIRTTLERGAKPTGSVAREITESLNRLPPGFALESERVLELMRTA